MCIVNAVQEEQLHFSDKKFDEIVRSLYWYAELKKQAYIKSDLNDMEHFNLSKYR